MVARPCVFLDRDGVINIPDFKGGRSYAPRTLEGIKYYPGVKNSLAELKAAGFFLIVVTNQPDVGKQDIELSVVEAIHTKMKRELAIDTIKACYHTKEDACSCRKPKPGMLEAALSEYNILLEDSYMVGDRDSDIKAGQAVGIRSIFLDLKYDRNIEPMPANPYAICTSLKEAANIILKDSKQERVIC